jgi:CarboxypepD_reg-like domain
MKLRLILMLLLFPLRLLAQRIDGVVLDKVTHRPVAFATVAAANSITATNADGRFSVPNIAPGDSLKITSIGYKIYKTGIELSTPKIITIYMMPASILLNDVVVKLKYDPKLDSVRVRKEFAAAFAYKRPAFKDMFITVDPYVYIPNNYINATNSTASLVSVNLLSLVNLLSKKSNDPNSKLQQTLLRDEETEYVDRAFSKQKIRSLTNLKGDSLLDFMDDFRPTIKQAKKMTDYEMVLYIKKSYADFIKTYSAEKHSPFAK